MTPSCLSLNPVNPYLQFPPSDLAPALGRQEPWDARDDAVDEATVFQPILQTVKHLTWNWMTLPLIATGASSAVAWTAFSTLATPPPAPDCAYLTAWASERTKLLCWQAAIAANKPNAQAAAIAWVSSWPPTHPLYHEGQGLLQTWSKAANPKDKVHSGSSGFSAIRPAGPRLSTTPPPVVTSSADATLLSLTQAAGIYETAVIALQEQDWAGAFQALWQLQDLEETLPELSLATKLARQIEMERQAQNLLNRAIQQWTQGHSGAQEDAIALMQQIDPATYVWQVAQPLLQTWQREYSPPIPVISWPTLSSHLESLAAPSMANTQAVPPPSSLPLPSQLHLGLLPERRYQPNFLASERLKSLTGRSHRP